ncbi:ABC transporter permease [Roseobacter sp. HKCCD7870]|uniref:ABC transporter permease n=1 Tax=Roseobacter sp. HKCCD7870 TaxID=3120343 RepID=UPI0030EB6DB6
MTLNSLSERVPWLWSLGGSLLIWAILMLNAGQLSFGPIVAAIVSGSFLLITAIGQSFAMMTAAGNVDLSMPGVITLSAYLSIWLVGGQNEATWIGLIAGMGLGALIGILNGLLVALARIPAIIATLAVGYVVTTFCLLANRELSANDIAPLLTVVVTQSVFGVPVIALLAGLISALAGFVYFSTGFGRLLLATGQNHQAAEMAGIPINKVIVRAFVISGALAGLTGVLLGARSGGAFLDMGKPYLLLSIGAVVVGGTPLFGGKVTIIGCAMGALFLILMRTLMPVLGFTGGEVEIAQGGMIIAVLVIGGIRVGNLLKAEA